MSRRVPVVLLAHGTRDERGRDELRALRSLVQEVHGARVRVGVIEYAAPGLEPVFDAVAAAAEDARAGGAGAVRIVPLLLFPAGHAQDDLPVVIRGARRLHPDVAVRCVPLLRPGAPLLRALRARIAEAEERAGARAEAVLVVGRGSTCAHANRRLERLVAQRLQEIDGRHAVHAFASLAAPDVTQALELLRDRGSRHVVVMPYLLNDGLIARRINDDAQRCAGDGMQVSVASHLGLHPDVIAYVRARAGGFRGVQLDEGDVDELRAVHGVTADTPSRGRRSSLSAVDGMKGRVHPVRLAVTAPSRRPRYPRPLVIAGTASGAGKTTVALGLMAALRRRGLRVQPFKVGPDFIDSLHHSAVVGRASRNLDGVLCPPPVVTALAARAMRDADVAVVEGVLGLFDGRLGDTDAGSTAEVARLLDAAVVLVIDAARAARSTGAVALGFDRFDPRVRIAGVVLNNVGSERHREAARESVERVAGLRVLGVLPRDPDITLPERYLGLVPPQERPQPLRWAERLAHAVEAGIDVDALLALAATPGGPRYDAGSDPLAAAEGRRAAAAPPSPRTRIAVARDAAFTFHYADALDLLQAHGAELVEFSPLNDAALPECGAVFLGGGFPERFAAMLHDNAPMRASVATAVRSGIAMVAECGGAMYLGDAITTEDGTRHTMCGVLSYGTRMTSRRRALGYRTATALRDSPLLRAGERVVGHEFHWSTADPGIDDATAAYSLLETGAREGHALPSLLASYVHLHLCGAPAAAARLVDTAAAVERARARARAVAS